MHRINDKECVGIWSEILICRIQPVVQDSLQRSEFNGSVEFSEQITGKGNGIAGTSNLPFK